MDTPFCQFRGVYLSLLDNFVSFFFRNIHFSHANILDPGPEVIKRFFVLNSVEQEISNAHKYKNIKKFSFCQAQISGEGFFSCS